MPRKARRDIIPKIGIAILSLLESDISALRRMRYVCFANVVSAFRRSPRSFVFFAFSLAEQGRDDPDGEENEHIQECAERQKSAFPDKSDDDHYSRCDNYRQYTDERSPIAV